MTPTLYQFYLDETFAGKPVEELNRKLALLLSTQAGTMPLDREFGLEADFLDSPSEASKSLFTAEVTAKVAKYIPEARVKEVSWIAGEAGSILPKVVITSA